MSVERVKSPLERRMEQLTTKAGLDIAVENLTVGAFIDEVRKARRLTIKALAERAEVQRPFLSLLINQNLVRRAEGPANRSDFENGDPRYKRLADVLEIDQTLFLELIEFVQTIPEGVDELLADARGQILETLNVGNLDPRQQKELDEALVRFYRQLKARER